MTGKTLRKFIGEEYPNVLLLPNFCDPALLGIGQQAGSSMCAVYDTEEVIRCFAVQAISEGTYDTEEEAYTNAVEWCDYNVFGAYVGDTTPIFTRSLSEETEDEVNPCSVCGGAGVLPHAYLKGVKGKCPQCRGNA